MKAVKENITEINLKINPEMAKNLLLAYDSIKNFKKSSELFRDVLDKEFEIENNSIIDLNLTGLKINQIDLLFFNSFFSNIKKVILTSTFGVFSEKQQWFENEILEKLLEMNSLNTIIAEDKIINLDIFKNSL